MTDHRAKDVPRHDIAGVGVSTTQDASSNRVCGVCSGTGHWIDDTCPECKGVDAIPKRVQSRHPHRLTWTKMERVTIADTQPVGAIKTARGPSRRRWHILENGEPLCERATSSDLGTTTVWGLVKHEKPCDRCHHELSWSPMPRDIEWRDCGYETMCLIWIRGLDKDGYGQWGRKGKWQSTHRAAYEQAKGPIPEGHILHHLCDQVACLNPDHLEPMTRSEHALLHNEEKGRGAGGEWL